MTKVTIVNQNCSPDAAKDTSLPYNSYLVEYKDAKEGKSLFDIAIAAKAVDLFDYYYDLYKKNFVKFVQSEGRVSPKLWQDPKAPKPKKKRGR